jgi:hypothetical protein
VPEFIPRIPEHETTPERFFWDRVIRALDLLEDASRSVGLEVLDAEAMTEAIIGLRGEDKEDALTLVFNYAGMIMSEVGDIIEIDEVVAFLEEEGFA